MFKYMKSTYAYAKKRKEFGKQPLFQIVPAHIVDSINPNKEEQKLYALRNPVHREVQATIPQSEHDANTKVLVICEQGINHTEGGWPREVHLLNEEHVHRHTRRTLHDDNYIHTVMSLNPQMKHYIDQNNAIDMYQTYFTDMTPQPPVEKYNVQITNAFEDSHKRPVSCIAWTNEKKSKLGVSYCYKAIGEHMFRTNVCYLWDINRHTSPIQELQPESACWQLACSPIDCEEIIAGLENGTVNVFDVRQGTKAVAKSSIYNSHRNAISSLLYTNSRTHTEFFTGSLDGQCLWWDKRNLSTTIDQLPISVRFPIGKTPSMSNAEGVSYLEFNHRLPTKFLCGTESGLVINANRMGRSHSEILTSYWKAHTGPVRRIQRSPCTLRMFITCGDWTVRIWSEEVRCAPIIVTKPYRYQVTDVVWSPLRYSSYMVACEGGFFYYWDILRNCREPLTRLLVSKYGLTKITPHHDGRWVAVGDNNGTVNLLQVSQNMTLPGNNDKQLVHQIYNRETRREHILDTRLKEINLKRLIEDKSESGIIAEAMEGDKIDETTEEEYFKIVKQELSQIE